MNKNLKSSRVLLDTQAVKDIFEMIVESKTGQEFVEITPSKLASWIISRYRSNVFNRDREIITQAHFNHQKALRHALKGASSEDELRAICMQTMKQVGKKRKKKRTENQTGQ